MCRKKRSFLNADVKKMALFQLSILAVKMTQTDSENAEGAYFMYVCLDRGAFMVTHPHISPALRVD